jgi:exopolysaccharide biosynthesis polyprenyl glycosylphosphotransferase
VTPRTPTALVVVGDLLGALAALWLAFWIRTSVPLPFTHRLLPVDRWDLLRDAWWIPLLLQPLVLYLFGQYDRRGPQPRAELLRWLSAAVLVLGTLWTGGYFFANRPFPRSVLVLFVLLDFALLVAWRIGLQRPSRTVLRRVAIVGCGQEAVELARGIAEHQWHGLSVAGFIAAPEDSGATGDIDLLGSVRDIPRLLREGAMDDVIVAVPSAGWRTALLDQLSVERPHDASLLLLPGPWESLIGQMRYRWVRDLPLIEVITDGARHRSALKRGFDLLAGVLLLVAASPLLLAAVALVRLTSRGAVFFRQGRVGQARRPFAVWKLRTMRLGAEEDGAEVLAQPDDARLTPVGSLLRRYRIDELPQLVNVLGGSMSLVGPRPERPGFVERYLREVPGYAERFVVRPGITGLAQVNGEYHSSPQNKLRYDLAYIANASFWLDLSILVRTVKIVLTSRGV